MRHINFISGLTGLPASKITGTYRLLSEGMTVPFIARYRKEATGSLNEEDVIAIQDAAKKYKTLEDRKKTILKAIDDQGMLDSNLQLIIHKCLDINTLEDIYLPFKKKRKTLAEKARKAGLEPLAKIIMSQRTSDINQIARKYLSQEYNDNHACIEGASHIISEWISEDTNIREHLRKSCLKGVLSSKLVKKKEQEASKYTDYWAYSERVTKIAPHRLLAVLRGKAEGMLTFKIEVDDEFILGKIFQRKIKPHAPTRSIIEEAIKRAYKKSIFPSVENQVIKEMQEKAEDASIAIFSKNLGQLLMSAPLGEKPLLAIDPGFRTGCKWVVLDARGDLIEHGVIYPHPPQKKAHDSSSTILKLLEQYQLKIIAIGDGTAGRETYEWLNKQLSDVKLYMVDEDGASIYSASKIGRDEFPDHDITVRGAVSIGRRLMDPMSELVKIDPQSLGIGQYQHDLNKKKLQDSLARSIGICVNKVGVNLNTASPYILQYVAGLGPTTAHNIVTFRDQNGPYTNRKDLAQVPKLGKKSLEQCLGFLRIKDGEEALDATGIHPETYGLTRSLVKKSGSKLSEVLKQKDALKHINPADFVTDKHGLPTIRDIISEIQNPGLDPRDAVVETTYDESVRKIEDLNVGKILQGTVSNLTGFGAFIDIGIKENGLVHISQISNDFIRDPAEKLSLNQHVTVKVIDIDISRKRIQLTMKI